MPQEPVRRRKVDKRYSFVIVPSGDSAHPRTYSLSRVGIIAALGAIAVLFTALILVVVVYTPAGRWLPVSHPELEYEYGRQLVEIQDQLNSLLGEMVTLRAYNVQLRRALGENITPEDSAFLATHQGEMERRQYRRATDTAHVAKSSGYMGTPSVTASDFGESGGYESAQQRPVSPISADLPFGSPARGYFTRGFDGERGHFGVDIAGTEGSTVSAAAGGRVVFANWTFEDGFEIILAHEHGYQTVYKHNRSLLRQVGDEVKRGDPIALLGNTGNTSSGPHLHFEVWKDGSALNPMSYLINVQ